MADYDLKWYKNNALLKLDGATAKTLAEAAFQIEAQAKINISQNGQVDTGFMRASVYTVAPQDVSNSGTSFEQARSDATGRNPDAVMSDKVTTDKDGAATVIGAAYAVYQEIQQPFLYPALQTVKGLMGGIIEGIARDEELK